MTIVAGFKSYEGIVLCADTQETVGVSKRSVPKLRFEPQRKEKDGVPEDELAVCFCGATDNGVFMDELVDRAWEDVQQATSLDEACDLIRYSIKKYYEESIRTYHPGYQPITELLYGVRLHDDSRLFYALGPAVTEKQTYAIGGQGGYIADFLASRMYKEHLSLKQCVILGAYILDQTKKHVEACGGDSHIGILRERGTSGRVDWNRVDVLTKLLKLADDDIGDVLLHVANLEESAEDLRQYISNLVTVFEALRDSCRTDVQQHVGMLKAMFKGLSGMDRPDEDEFGLPKLSVSQKSAGQQ